MHAYVSHLQNICVHTCTCCTCFMRVYEFMSYMNSWAIWIDVMRYLQASRGVSARWKHQWKAKWRRQLSRRWASHPAQSVRNTATLQASYIHYKLQAACIRASGLITAVVDSGLIGRLQDERQGCWSAGRILLVLSYPLPITCFSQACKAKKWNVLLLICSSPTHYMFLVMCL